MRSGFSLAVGAAAIMLTGAATASAPDAVHYHRLASYTVGGDGGWDYLTVDGRAQRLYVSRGTHVMVMNTDTGKIVGDIPDTQGVHGIALVRSLHRGYTSNGREGTVTVFDTETLAPVTKVTVDRGPDCIIYDSASKRVFTFNGASSSATAIDTDTNKVAGTIPLPGRPEYAVSDGQGHVYDNIEDKSEIVEIDSKALKVTHTWPIAPGEGPSGLAMDRRSRRLFAVCDNGKMVVLNADTGAVVATPAIGEGPDAAAFDGRRHVALSSNGQGTLTVVREDDPDHFAVAANVPTQPGARTMAVDTRSGNVYLVTATPAPGPAASGGERRRRTYVPGSFTVLVYAP